jgi:membrane associated rhomboid family serine protease
LKAEPQKQERSYYSYHRIASTIRMKRERDHRARPSPNLPGRGGGLPPAPAGSTKKYAPPTSLNNYETIEPSNRSTYRPYSANNVLSPETTGGRNAISPRSGANSSDVSANGERPPTRVFFPKNGPGALVLDDSVTIDSDLEDPRSAPADPSDSPSVYHLAHDNGIRRPSPKHRAKLEAWYRKQGGRRRATAGVDNYSQSQQSNHLGRSMSSEDEDYSAYSTPHTVLSEDGTYLSKGMSEDEDFLKTKQEIAFLSIGVTSIQLLTICLQFAMCGIAPLEVNPFVGPYPDAFSEWGGKNGYLMITNHEYWRIISPAALSVGILHLLANAFCQLEPVAIFEREWGSFRWMLIYVLSSVGCNTLSVYVDPDTIAVGSSGSLMGLFAAKLAQVMIHTLFDVNKASQDEFIRLDQLSSVVFGLVVISVLSFFTFIDWSGHLGGLMAGFFAGMVLFSNPIRSCCVRFLWTFLGLSGLVVTLTGSVYLAITESTPSEDLADACTYFRNVYAEDVECGCLA